MGDLTASAAQTTAKEVIGAKMLELARGTHGLLR